MAEKGMNANVKMTSSETLLSHDIPMRDGFMSSIKIQKPSSAPPGPLIVLFFGGGYVGGTNEQLLYIGIVLVRLLGATVVSPSYRLGPEHKFPASQHDVSCPTNLARTHHGNPIGHTLTGHRHGTA